MTKEIMSQNMRNLQKNSSDQRLYFAGWVVHCLLDDLEDIKVIYGGVEAWGGLWRTEVSEDLTHIVTLSDNSEVCSNAISKGVKLILPEFFDDCFRLGQKCPEDSYIFPFPKVLCYSFDALSNLVKVPKDTPSIQTSVPFLKSKVVFIDPDLAESPALNTHIVELKKNMRANAAQISDDLTEANVLITNYQGDLFKKVIMTEKVIGSVRWMNDQLKVKHLIDPTSKVLYYPCPIYPIPEMQSFVVTVTNYSGQAREDVFTMASHMGCKVTRNMSMDNTHLICGIPTGEKYHRGINQFLTLASLWNLHIVNHLWLEETYANWAYQREAKPQFLHFPVSIVEMVNSLPVTSKLGHINRQSTVTKKRPMIQPVIPSSHKKSKPDEIKTLLFTGIRLLPASIKAITDLGFIITDGCSSFDVLVSTKITRSEKFLIAVSKGIPIADVRWLDSMISRNCVLNVQDYLLADTSQEEKFSFQLSEAILKARSRPLLSGYSVFYTENILPDISVMSRLVKAAGGVVQDKISKQSSAEILSSLKSTKILLGKGTDNFIILSSGADFELCEPFRKENIPIYTTGLLLTGLLRQELELENPEYKLT
ncbi:hypothetical protein BC833DRAFT_617019 [Globomyces pollinis-pini]|nr:hypothetical protein BC833DRAFT_617019 [Globomyces pollinis-pini]